MEKNINICIPTLNRYDLLERLIDSLLKSTIQITKIFIVDNGTKLDLDYFNNKYPNLLIIMNFGYNLGIAASWNWFGKYVNEYRIVCNDDIVFHPNAVKELIKSSTPDRVPFPTGIPDMNAFSCFLWNDDIIEKVGYFDEQISPNYGYFEDNDYNHRMNLVGITILPVPEATVDHDNSSTIKLYSKREKDEHDIKFRRARRNYLKKWGGLPTREIFKTPYNK